MRSTNRKIVCLFIVLAAVVAVAVGATTAFLMRKTPAVSNHFVSANPGIEIEEDLTTDEKKDVKVKNTGDFDAYVRAQIVVSWQDADGNLASVAPVAGTDYIADIDADNWLLRDGTYYHKTAVAPAGETEVLIHSIKSVEGKAPDGYMLCVDVLASTVQAKPATAVTELWNVYVDTDGNLALSAE